MTVKTVGLDLAMDVFQVHGISENDRVIFNKAIKRAKLLAFFETLPPCKVGMEACGSSHHWGRQLRKLGHDVKLMPAGYVKPYGKRGKNDAVDAELSQPRARTLREWQRPLEADNPIGTSLAELIRASGTPPHKQAGQTTVLTKTTAKIARKLLQCRSHPQMPFASWPSAAAQLHQTGHWLRLQILVGGEWSKR